MVSKVARNRFVSREKRHMCCNGVICVVTGSGEVKSFRLSIVNRYNSHKDVRYVNKRLLDL